MFEKPLHLDSIQQPFPPLRLLGLFKRPGWFGVLMVRSWFLIHFTGQRTPLSQDPSSFEEVRVFKVVSHSELFGVQGEQEVQQVSGKKNLAET